MTLASAIITAGFREGNILPVGGSPTTSEQTEALGLLNGFISGVFGNEMGEPLSDWMVPQPQRTGALEANYPQLPYPQGTDAMLLPTPLTTSALSSVYRYPPKNSRIVFGGVTQTIYFPEQPDDGSRMAVVQGSGAGDSATVGAVLTLDGNGRTIETVNTKTFTFTSPATAGKAWLYRADTADWVAVATLGLSDALPFPSELDDVWITALAIRLAPRYGKTVAAETTAAFTAAMRHLKARYRQAGTTIFGAQDIPNSFQSYGSTSWMWR